MKKIFKALFFILLSLSASAPVYAMSWLPYVKVPSISLCRLGTRIISCSKFHCKKAAKQYDNLSFVATCAKNVIYDAILECKDPIKQSAQNAWYYTYKDVPVMPVATAFVAGSAVINLAQYLWDPEEYWK